MKVGHVFKYNDIEIVILSISRSYITYCHIRSFLTKGYDQAIEQPWSMLIRQFKSLYSPVSVPNTRINREVYPEYIVADNRLLKVVNV